MSANTSPFTTFHTISQIKSLHAHTQRDQKKIIYIACKVLDELLPFASPGDYRKLSNWEHRYLRHFSPPDSWPSLISTCSKLSPHAPQWWEDWCPLVTQPQNTMFEEVSFIRNPTYMKKTVISHQSLLPYVLHHHNSFPLHLSSRGHVWAQHTFAGLWKIRCARRQVHIKAAFT